MPPLPSGLASFGSGVAWIALALGSGELVWWPYLVAKYGLTFVWLLIPACLLPYPLTVAIGRYTLLTGEGIFRGFHRLHPLVGAFFWAAMTLSLLWLGTLTAAGGAALAALTHLPGTFSARGRALFWAYLAIALAVGTLALSRRRERVVAHCAMMLVLVVVLALLWACAQPEVRTTLPAFAAALAGSPGPSERAWDVHDAAILVTALTFAGLGSFRILAYSYWLRGAGRGMAAHATHGRELADVDAAAMHADGHLVDDDPASAERWPRWRRFLTVDAAVAILGNLIVVLLACVVAYALLYPRALVPQDDPLGTAAAAFFTLDWGRTGRVVFLAAVAAALLGAWLLTVDAVSRMHADMLVDRIAGVHLGTNGRYWIGLALATAITCGTTPFAVPLTVHRISAFAALAGVVLVPAALLLLGRRPSAPALPRWALPRRGETVLLGASLAVYVLLAITWAWASWPW